LPLSKQINGAENDAAKYKQFFYAAASSVLSMLPDR